MANDVLMDISRKVGAAATAATVAPVVVARDAIADALKPVVRAINPMTYAKMTVAELDRVTGITKMFDAYKKIYGLLSSRKDDDGKAVVNPLLDLKEQSKKQVKLLDLILDVLMSQYDIAKATRNQAKRNETLEKFRRIESEREGLRDQTVPNIQVMGPTESPFTKLALLLAKLPGWLTKTLGIGTVGGLATFLGFDKIVAAWNVIKTTFKNLTTAITDSVASTKKLITSLKVPKVLQKVVDGFKFVVDEVGKVSRAIGRWLPKVKGILGVVGKVSSSVSRFAKFLGGPFLLAIIGMADFIEGFVRGYEDRNVFNAVKEGIKEVFRGIITEPLDLVKDLLSWVSEKIGLDSFSSFLDSFSFTEQFDKVSASIEAALTEIGTKVTNLDFNEVLGRIGTAIKTTFQTKFIAPIDGFITEIGLTKLLDITPLFESIQGVVDSVKDFVAKFDVTNFKDEVLTKAGEVGKILSKLNPFEGVSNAVQGMVDTFDNIDLIGRITSVTSDLAERVKNLFDPEAMLKDLELPNVIGELSDRIKDFVSRTLDRIKEMFDFSSIKSMVFGDSTPAATATPTPEVTSTPSVPARSVIQEGGKLTRPRGAGPVYFDNKKYVTNSVAGGGSTGNASRNVKVNSEASRSRWERRQGGVSGW